MAWWHVVMFRAYGFPGTGTCCADVRPNLGDSLFWQGNGRLTCWIEAMLDSYLPNILDKEDGGKSAEMWIEAWDMIGTVVRNTTWNCGSKLKSYCHYSDVNMDVTCFNLCKITTWSRNKMPEACCKAALIWDLILFEEFHIFVRFISSLIDFPYISPFCCSVVCLFNPVFFFFFFFSCCSCSFCRDLTVSNLQIWLKKNPSPSVSSHDSENAKTWWRATLGPGTLAGSLCCSGRFGDGRVALASFLTNVSVVILGPKGGSTLG